MTDRDIDALYQLPLGEFTAARKALAKEAAKGVDLTTFEKPSVPAGGVNKLSWRERRTYER